MASRSAAAASAVAFTAASSLTAASPDCAAAFHVAASCNQRELASLMLLEREQWYRGLVAKKPKSAAFLRGWLNRTSDCRALVERLAARWGITE